MRRQRFDPYANTKDPHYVVLWDMQHHVVEHTKIEPDIDLRHAMTAAMKRLELDGWTFESDAKNGSCFLGRGGERRLLSMTPQDPTVPSHVGYCPGIQYPTLETACLAQVTHEYYLGAYCRNCKHAARLSIERLRAKLGGDYPVHRLRGRLRCEKCGDKRQVVVSFLTPSDRAGNLVHLFERPTQR